MSSATATYSTLVAARRLKLALPEPPSPTTRSFSAEPALSFAHNTSVNAIAFPDGARYVYTGGSDGFVRKFDIYDSLNGVDASNRNLHAKTGGGGEVPGGILAGYWAGSEWLGEGTTGPASGRYDPSTASFGSRSVTTGVDAPPAVQSLVAHSAELFGLSGTSNGEITLFGIRLDEGQCRHVLRAGEQAHAPDAAVNSLCLTGQESALISAGSDRKMLHWDLNTGRIVRRYGDPNKLPTASVTHVAMRPLSGSGPPPSPVTGDDAMDVDALQLDDTGSDARQVSDDALLSVSSDGSVTVWDRRNSSPPCRLRKDDEAPAWALNASWSPSGDRICIGRQNNSFEIHDVRSGKRQTLKLPETFGAVYDIVPFADTRFLLIATHANLIVYDLDWAPADDESTKPATPWRIVSSYTSSAVSKLRTSAIRQRLTSTDLDRSNRLALVAFGSRGASDGQTSLHDGVLVSTVKSLQ